MQIKTLKNYSINFFEKFFTFSVHVLSQNRRMYRSDGQLHKKQKRQRVSAVRRRQSYTIVPVFVENPLSDSRAVRSKSYRDAAPLAA
jgi:hypothetical protein